MRFLRAAAVAFFISGMAVLGYGATEIRMLGGPGPLNDGDIYFGNAYWNSPAGRRVYFVNQSMIPYNADNTVYGESLYVLAAGGTGTPYDNGTTWFIDNNATFMSRHWTGSGEFLKYDGTRGAGGNTGTSTAILKGDGAGGFDDATPGTDYVVPAGNVATATALAANPVDCSGGQFAVGIDANGTAVCDTPTGTGNMLKSVYDVDTDNVVDTAEALSAQYIDWNQSSGPTSIANKPTIGTMAAQAAGSVAITGGTMSGVTITSSTMAAKQDADADLTTLASLGNSKMAYTTDAGVMSSVTLGTSGTYLKSNGPSSAPSFETGGGGSPGGSDTQVQFNDGGSFGGSSGMTYNKTLHNLSLDNTFSAPGMNSTATDNTRFFGKSNTGDLMAAYQAAGRFWFNGTSNMTKVRNGDNTATLEVFTSGAAHTLSFATTGTLTGGIMILDDVASPTAAQCYGSWNETSGAGTHTLPAVAAGMAICHGTSAAAEIILELDNSDHFVLNGVTMSDGEAIINSTAEAAGDYICVIGLNSTTWKVVGKQGVWTQATP